MRNLFLRHWVISSLIPRMATPHSFDCQPATFPHAKFFNRFIAVIATSRMKTTNPPTKKPRWNALIQRKNFLINPNQKQHDFFQHISSP